MRRRQFLGGSLAAAFGFCLDEALLQRLLAQDACADREPAGELVRLLPLTGDRARATPYGKVVGGPGLDSRVFTDLSRITADRIITPADEVFVRTAPPPAALARQDVWTVALGDEASAGVLRADDLRAAARPMGVHLIECAGNNDPDNFGLLSAAEWSGMPLAEAAARAGSREGSFGVLVTGEDDETQLARSSRPGASWVLSWEAIERQRPFLATHLNGRPLTPEHGAPVRLVVPGWYGCAWIKWVRELRLVGADVTATAQMQEFSGRTHQEGVPQLARDYAPPEIDTAATPIRVEQRRVDGRLEYRVVGIVWGGQAPVEELLIRFDSRETWRRLRLCSVPGPPSTWSLWTYRWQPIRAGTYSIAVKCADPAVRTRRLDMFFYTRRVRIEQV